MKREFMSDDQLRDDFNKRFSKSSRRRWLEGIARRNRDLVNKFILGANKNAFYTPFDRSSITKNDNEYYALVDWIIPTKSYNYREANRDIAYEKYCENRNVSRSSIIPIVKLENSNYWLLNNFKDYEDTNDPILADFGGKCEAEDRDNSCPPLKCAERELNEESKGLLTNFVRKAIEEGNIAILEGTSRDGDKINFLFVELNYEDVKDIPERFNAIPSEERLGKLGFYKQRDVKSGKYRTSKNLTDLLLFLYRTRQ